MENSWAGRETGAVDTIRLLIVDDAAQVRADLALALGLVSRLQVVGEAAEGAEAIAKARALYPDVVVMDVNMPGMDGLTATAEIKRARPDTKVVVLTVDLAVDAPARAAGADAFVAKGAPLAELVSAIVASAPGATDSR